MTGDNPQRAGELRGAARALMVGPWRTAAGDPAVFALVRRHADALDRWFTQRLGYRLVVHSDTARLVKSGYVPADRPLRTHTDRPFTQREYVLLALILAATASGPERISLRDLVLLVRSAAADAGVVLDPGAAHRRALVTVLRWLIDRGVMRELDRTISGYESNDDVDALLEIRNDRLLMLATPALNGASDADDLLARADRPGGRAAARRRLAEDPVVSAADLPPDDWTELRRRASEESRFMEEMFGFAVETRAEGAAAIDVDGGCSDVVFPRSGTVPHAALLLLAVLVSRYRNGADEDALDLETRALVGQFGAYWRADAATDPASLRAEAVETLLAMRLVSREPDGRVTPCPAAARFAPAVTVTDTSGTEAVQEFLL